MKSISSLEKKKKKAVDYGLKDYQTGVKGGSFRRSLGSRREYFVVVQPKNESTPKISPEFQFSLHEERAPLSHFFSKTPSSINQHFGGGDKKSL